MKPLDRLTNEPDKEVVIHELGHTVAGLMFELAEGGIEFCDPSTGEVARSHFNKILGSPREWIIRGIAGMFCQAKIVPESISDDLRSDILNGTIFTRRLDDIETQTIPSIISEHGFQGDWLLVLSYAQEISSERATQISEITSAHQRLESAFEDRGIRKKIDLAYRDFKDWLNTDDPDVELSPMLFYSVSRVRNAIGT